MLGRFGALWAIPALYSLVLDSNERLIDNAGMTIARTSDAPPRPIDALDPAFYDDPWDAYRWLRNHGGPLFWDEANELWVAARHEDVSHISRHPELFSAAQGVRPRIAAPMSLISLDDPEHTRQRRLINKGFTPRMVRELTDHIRQVCDEIIDGIATRGQCEFVADFAVHVPLIVIAELMGLDPAQRGQLYRWSDAMMAGDGHTAPDDPVLLAAADAFAGFTTMCADLVDERRQRTTDDIIGVLTRAYDDGGLERGGLPEEYAELGPSLNDEELLMFCALLVVAGNETTRNALTGGLLAFSRFPEQKARLIAEPDLIDSAVEEIVRYVTPVLTFSRTVTHDHRYKGVDLAAGQKVLMLYQSANRDETVFDDPDEFRIDRQPNPHLSFGIGTHYCLGANLARAEIKVVFEQLFARLRDIRVPDGVAPTRGRSSLVLALERLPAVFTPQPAA
jgi:cytochrome P450 family 142 subfamily A polypeptide 1